MYQHQTSLAYRGVSGPSFLYPARDSARLLDRTKRMKIPERCWQIAAGDGDRNYTKICIDHDVIVAGPSYTGDWNTPELPEGPTASERLKSDNWSSRQRTGLDTFANKIKEGDLVVLRIGKSEVHGVGIVRSAYEFNDLFSDVDGWDLAHTHPVEWVANAGVAYFKDALNRGDTTQRLDPAGEKTEALFAWIRTLPEPSGRVLEALPKRGRDVEPRTISRHLFDYGMGSGSLSGLESRIADLCSPAKWYGKYQKPSESETVAHLVVPLLLALGWTPQRIALEFHQSGKGRADLALYPNGNRTKNTSLSLL